MFGVKKKLRIFGTFGIRNFKTHVNNLCLTCTKVRIKSTTGQILFSILNMPVYKTSNFQKPESLGLRPFTVINLRTMKNVGKFLKMTVLQIQTSIYCVNSVFVLTPLLYELSRPVFSLKKMFHFTLFYRCTGPLFALGIHLRHNPQQTHF